MILFNLSVKFTVYVFFATRNAHELYVLQKEEHLSNGSDSLF